MKRTTKEWVGKAEADYLAAVKLQRGNDPLHDVVCFHGQQCAEKYLKALLEEAGLTVPRTHNLVSLLPLLLPHHGELKSFRRGLDFLTRYAVDTRYPGDKASKRQAAGSLRWSGKIRHAARAILGLPPRRARRKK